MGVDIFSMALDALMVIAITGLWVMWYLQAGQRKKVEKMLLEASEEMQEATQLLASVMGSLEGMNRDPVIREEADVQSNIEHVFSQDVVDIRSKQNVEPEQTNAKDASNCSSQIMRLNREGLSEEEIAEQLALPIAQVHLILLLQAPKSQV